MRRLVGAYVCHRGAFAIDCRMTRVGVEVRQTLALPAELATPQSAVKLLVSALADAGIESAEVAVAIRGFETVHHAMGLPPARDELLAPVIDRELRRLEPSLRDPVVAWLTVPVHVSAASDTPAQRQVLVGAAPKECVDTFEAELKSAGHQLLHLTLLPAAFQRLQEEFEPTNDPLALVATLPDGPFMAFFLGGALRLAVEPPMQEEDVQHDPAALAEEMDLGAMFLRQQFRGAQIARVAVATTPQAFVDLESPIAERLGVPVTRLAVRELSAAAFAALGAVLDAQSSVPLALGGHTRRLAADRSRSWLRVASFAAVMLAALLATFAMVEALRARDAGVELQSARRQIEQESFGMTPLRETASRRKLIRDAVAALHSVTRDRQELRQSLTALASSKPDPVRLDSIQLDVNESGWAAMVAGSIRASSNARAVQAVHDFYRELPRRIPLDQLSLDQISYADAPGSDHTLVRFRLSFMITPVSKAD